eukprot:TRINITY_DN2328_c0_g1_i1.p1 TRINITY_DN2328_c0_g1~~TRINITY_DN2328_c0_g1_i1.p1  ORF type:complete len:203 (-),score=44.75 TRINITY_DN2328_c0_g1_i1:507-1115(-)
MASHLNAKEVEFLAEDDDIHIIPSFSCPPIHFIKGDVGPFRAGVQIVVPFWLAIQMRQAKKCAIQPPEWMDIDALKNSLKGEKSDDQKFSPLPYHYIEIGHLLLKFAKEDIPNAGQVDRILHDIKLARQQKTTLLMQSVKQGDLVFQSKLTGLAAMELNTIKPFFLRALDNLTKLTQLAQNASVSSEQSSSSNMSSKSDVKS